MKRFARTVVMVLTAYANLLKQDFPNHVKDEATVGGNKTIIINVMENKVPVEVSTVSSATLPITRFPMGFV